MASLDEINSGSWPDCPVAPVPVVCRRNVDKPEGLVLVKLVLSAGARTHLPSTVEMTSNRESPCPDVEVPRNLFKENAGRPLLAKSIKVIDANESGSFTVILG